MKDLQEIKNEYPEAFKAKPKGWKFIHGNAVVRGEDKIWINGAYMTLQGSYLQHFVGTMAFSYKPIIREIKVAPKPPKVPDGLAIPSGHVYIGLGNNCHPSWNGGSPPEYFDFIYFSKYWKDWRNLHGHCSSASVAYHIAAKIDSPLHKAQPWYKPQNIKAQLSDSNKKIEELTKDLANCKAELQTYKTFYDRVKGLSL